MTDAHYFLAAWGSGKPNATALHKGEDAAFPLGQRN